MTEIIMDSSKNKCFRRRCNSLIEVQLSKIHWLCVFTN